MGKHRLSSSDVVIRSAAVLGIALLLFPTSWAQPKSEVWVQEFGAVGDGTVLNTASIQQAIDAMAEAGGGTVVFSAGRYLSGTIYLKSHVTLHLQSGAVLLGSTQLEDYPVNFCDYASWSDKYCVRALIWAEGQENIGIVGRGTIDGQGKAFFGHKASEDELRVLAGLRPDVSRYAPQSQYANRPYGIRMIGCRDVLVEGITMQYSAMWMQQYLHCNHVMLRNLRVINQGNRNNDMVDIDSSQNVIVTGCYGDSDDDAITLKSTGPDPTENVTISNCILRSHANAIKMGTESHGGFRNITITNCVILRSEFEKNIGGSRDGYAGIALELVDGGLLERIAISNITMEGIWTPIFMRLGNRGRVTKPGLPKPGTGSFRDVTVDNIVATGVGNMCSSITGIPGHPIEGVSLSNIRIRCDGGVPEDLTSQQVPELVDEYPEAKMFGPLPAYGFYSRHVKDLTLRNVTVEFEEPDRRYPLVFEDVENLTIEAFQPMVTLGTPAAILFEDVRQAWVRGCRPFEMKTFIRLRGGCEGIITEGNQFENVESPTKEF